HRDVLCCSKILFWNFAIKRFKEFLNFTSYFSNVWRMLLPRSLSRGQHLASLTLPLCQAFRKKSLLIETNLEVARIKCVGNQSKANFCAHAHTDKFIPECNEPSDTDLARLREFLDTHQRLFVLTGAGLSTESGIPDYRSEGVGLYATSPNRPVQYIDFLKNDAIRQRYWARNYMGWPRFSSFQPNRCHYVLSDWERKGRIHWLVTQNVDALHFKAGSRRVTELHGSTHRVLCLSCSYRTTRHAFQAAIDAANQGWSVEAKQILADRPDGDVDLDSEKVKEFVVPPCPSCGGILKPEVTFFGDNVPKTTVHFVLEKLFNSDAVLVLGSSLEVYSGYRFALRAHDRGIKIAVVNIGPTRADKLVDVKVSAKCGDVLQRLLV
ncbi:hypothetical protein EGW08_009868, partial [Elysia chlorotica]